MQILKFLRALFRRIKPTSPKDSEKGAITVAETLIALGIGATVIGVVFAGIPAMINARNASTGLTGLMQIATVVRNTYGIRNNFTGLDTELAVRLAGFPPHFVDEDAAQHPWGGAITIGPNANTQRFDITFEDMPEDGCNQIVASTQDAVETITIGGSSIGEDQDGDPNTVDPATITDLCDGGDTDIVWTFGG